MGAIYKYKKIFLFFLAFACIMMTVLTGQWFIFSKVPINKGYNVSEQMEIRRVLSINQCKDSTNKTVVDIVRKKKDTLFGSKNFLYCPIPKVGSTTWKQILILLKNKCKKCTNVRDVKRVHDILNDYWDSDKFRNMKKVLDRSQKMIIVREPYSRLLSGYINKVFIPVRLVFWENTWKYVERKRPVSHKKCVDFTFPEIVRYVIKAIKTNTMYNAHFDTMSNICKPCEIRYDYILKMETFNVDTMYMLKKLNRSDVYNDTDTLKRDSIVDSITWDINNMFRKDTGKCQSKPEKIRRLWRSFQISGYIGKNVKLPLSKKAEKNISKQELLQIVINATKIKNANNKVNKRLALIEAYSQVPYSDLVQLSEIFQQDCDIFGYDCKPDILFNRTKYPPSTNFLDIWST
ncbi:hypothetical protein LOTGIDRAFT_229633 [Lottia gigantea]|uniref:Carbohydrate sulfotransferase n=1 Tax=Lottia gigantea TaxID=225164 RepID=V3ZNU1_LOTGI|nr:hypothetical protein LOTGIDRAFT_229633 [Lottia gigantea]ESO84150.1 hypothetical protein LOTGIDRAFT_229633 [Lottia gigantea]